VAVPLSTSRKGVGGEGASSFSRRAQGDLFQEEEKPHPPPREKENSKPPCLLRVGGEEGEGENEKKKENSPAPPSTQGEEREKKGPGENLLTRHGLKKKEGSAPHLLFPPSEPEKSHHPSIKWRRKRRRT